MLRPKEEGEIEKMFSYYGSKSKIVQYYPRPTHDKIIEPFAGSARYSLRYWEKDILLVDKYKVIVGIWHYLQRASEKDILSLPNISYKESIPKTLTDEERWLIGYCIGRGVTIPCTKGHNFNSWDDDKKRIASNLFKIRHWKIIQGSYEDLENENATWFIDPPYEVGGYKYSHNKIDYNSLANWCKTRQGQVIVCENTKATWMDFKPMISNAGMYSTTTEAIWTNFPTQYDSIQMEFFKEASSG